MHFKFWGQSLNKGTWLTVAAKDTNYFHQTVVITIKSCLSINQLLLPRAQPSMHFKGDPTFQSLQEVMSTISSLPLQEKEGGGIPLGMFLLQVVFSFTSMSLKHQDKSVNVFFQDFYKRVYFTKIFRMCMTIYGGQRSMQGVFFAHFLLYLCISWLDWLPREPRGSSRLCFLPLRLQACVIMPRFWHVWSEFRSSCFMLMQQELYPLRNLPSPVTLIFWVLLGYGTFRMQDSLEKMGHWRKQLLRVMA